MLIIFWDAVEMISIKMGGTVRTKATLKPIRPGNYLSRQFSMVWFEQKIWLMTRADDMSERHFLNRALNPAWSISIILSFAHCILHSHHVERTWTPMAISVNLYSTVGVDDVTTGCDTSLQGKMIHNLPHSSGVCSSFLPDQLAYMDT